MRAGEPSAFLGLLGASRQVHDETLDLFYGNSLFVVVLGEDTTAECRWPPKKPNIISSPGENESDT